jgi:hypothetical protein
MHWILGKETSGTTEDGESFLTEEIDGKAAWMDALGLHYAQNVGETQVRIILVEVKAALTPVEGGAS